MIMSVKKPKKKMMDNTIPIPSGSELINDKEFGSEIKKKYTENDLTESARLIKKTKKTLDK